MGRIIGIRHRRKKTVDGEARPTQVAIVDGGKTNVVDLPDDQAELDFVFGQFPTKFRDVAENDNLEDFAEHHVKWRAVKKDEEVPNVPEKFIWKEGKKVFVPAKVPSAYEGLAPQDTVAMPLGGSGNMLSYAIVQRLEEIGGAVFRIPPHALKAERDAFAKEKGEHATKYFDPLAEHLRKAGEKGVPATKTQPVGSGAADEFRGKRIQSKEDKSDDSVLLVHLYADKPYLFYKSQSRDKKVILVRELYRQRINAMKDRIACELRLREAVVGKCFTKHSPEAAIEKRFAEEEANDPILQNMRAIESKANRELFDAIEELDVYNRVFAPLEGVGPQTSARIIAGIMDIRQFEDRDKFVAFCGTSPTKEGKFRRFKLGVKCNWSPQVRQGLYLIISDQANKRPNSVWGLRLREEKRKLREKHPAPVQVEAKGENGETRKVKRYTDGHIHKMATWKTMTKLARYIYREWTALERESHAPTGPLPEPMMT